MKKTRYKEGASYKRIFNFEVKTIDRENKVVYGIFSTSDEDRHGEIVDQSGWKLENFWKNPVVLWAHDHFTPAIGKAEYDGARVEVVDGKLQGPIEFAVGINPLADVIFELIANQFIRTFSVGFRNNRIEFDEENDKVYLRDNELYEISVVNVPALPAAMVEASAKGINVEPLRAALAKKTEKAVEWAIGNDYAVNDECEHNGVLYTCITAHEATAENEPGVGPQWELIWKADTEVIAENSVSPDEATAVLSKTNVETMKSAIKVLQEAVAQAEGHKQLSPAPASTGSSGGRKIKKTVLNSAIRQLIKASKVVG